MGAWHIYPGASTVVSQPLDSSPMAGKSPQPSYDPLFQAPVTLKQDETVEGDIEGGVGDAKKPFHANATDTETAPFDTPGCDEANTFHVSLTVDRRKLLSSWTTSLLNSWTATPLSSRTATPLVLLVDRFTAKLENRYTASLARGPLHR